jgi:hypothetical protein
VPRGAMICDIVTMKRAGINAVRTSHYPNDVQVRGCVLGGGWRLVVGGWWLVVGGWWLVAALLTCIGVNAVRTSHYPNDVQVWSFGG